MIERIKHSIAVIPELPAPLREAAVNSYADGLKVVFICQAVWNVVAFLCCLPIEERPLPCVSHILVFELTGVKWVDFFLEPRWRNRRGCIESDKIRILNGANRVPRRFRHIYTLGIKHRANVVALKVHHGIPGYSTYLARQRTYNSLGANASSTNPGSSEISQVGHRCASCSGTGQGTSFLPPSYFVTDFSYAACSVRSDYGHNEGAAR